MTVCDVCGGEQFTLEDGFFFCNECQTQSQDIREMVTDDMYATGATLVRSAVVSEKTLADRRRRREMRAEVRGVRQFLGPAEVLNELLRRWTTKLVARGAPAQLPEVTAQLWEALLRTDRSQYNRQFGLKIAVSLLWLAMVECDPMCRLSDLLRWARLDIVPIYTAVNELPEDVTAAWTTIRLLKPLGEHSLRLCLRYAVQKLRLPPPPQPPLRQLLRRLLAELALPARLADVVANVARRAPPPDTFMPEADALALLLVTLKMLLGLDDATEIRNSEVAAARNERQPDGQRWFVFTEWLQFVRQQRAAAGEQDFLELESHDRQLQTVGGPDLCRRRHRQLLFDYYRRDGTFRRSLESSFAGMARCLRPEYKLQTRQLFGRPEAPAAPPPSSDTDDLLRPVISRLEREGGEPLRQAETWRHSQVEFLLDESHVRRLQSEGVPVAVTHAAARQRVQVTRATRFLPRDIELVGTRKQAIPPPKPPPRRSRPRRDLRLFMPCGEVWCLTPAFMDKPSKATYSLAAASWPATYLCLLEALASSIELLPVRFSQYVSHAERSVFGAAPKGSTEDRKRRNERRRQMRKRRKVADGSATDGSAMETERGSETETDAEADEAPYSPDLFE